MRVVSFLLLISIITFSAQSAVDTTTLLNQAQAQVQTKQKDIFGQQKNNANQQQNKQQAGLGNESFSKLRDGLLLPGEADIRDLLPSIELDSPPPYGANLFAGGYESERVEGVNKNYLIGSGDKVSIWLWGAVNMNQVLTVDNQGNVFLPNIGPIKLSNVPAGNVSQVVNAKVKSTYKNNVEVYVNLLSATPITVFITGSVVRPGQYAGMASDTILYYLKRAGGIDSERGSYRKVSVIRDGEIVKDIDLYSFIQSGTLPLFTFKNNDTILVSDQGPTIDVMGAVKKPFRFELQENLISGEDVMKLATPLSNASHVLVQGTRKNGPFSVYLTLESAMDYKLQSGDKLQVKNDLRAQVYDIEIQGSYLGPSFYTVGAATKLHDLLSYVPIDERLADNNSIYILRKSVAEQQKEILDQSLERLERTVFFSPSSSTGEASIKSSEAKLITDFIERARTIEPLGKVIVSDNGNVANIALEQGDTIVIPNKSDLIQIGGEVMIPQAVVYNENAQIEDYIAWAGGYSNRADTSNFVIVHANGLTEILESDERADLVAGDKIVIMPKVETKVMQAVKDITQIMFQLAVTANAVTSN